MMTDKERWEQIWYVRYGLANRYSDIAQSFCRLMLLGRFTDLALRQIKDESSPLERLL